ncbi:MarR family winged helix-turn-helix transcriptional regulator [Hoyosella altamirensis]|uniref:DNA-binding MarR family transcriptional regulator n=1 Tax=Hoyosella altamirensis TaxID=616997 RepID=A0A839RML1_9ACTN|nr:MarR family transcriptional regulator [Hoyosella altamirensis]MBB3038172.1 DNA-binding MarR family transcriptional regulator [Hoyosella altamirensis]
MSIATTDASLLKLLTLASRAVERELNRELRAVLDDSLRPAHFAVFRYLDSARTAEADSESSQPGVRVTELADAAGMTQQSMGELVAHLEQCGLVERRVAPADRRARLVTLTDAGRDALAIARRCTARIDDVIRDHIGARAFADLRTQLASVYDLYQQGER